jgi:hypothetical protein
MLIKVKDINISEYKIKATKLDIDDYGSIIPLKDLELKVSADNDSIIQTLKNSSYAAVFTQGDDIDDDNNGIIILANGMTIDELNKEKSKTVDKVASKKK